MIIVDAHTHYWEPASSDRPWDPTGASLGPPVSAEALLAEARAAGVSQVVQITPGLMGGDNRYALECAARFPDRIAGVFGRLDPTRPDVRAALQALAASPKFAGIRLAITRPSELAWITDGTIEHFFLAMAELQLAISIFFPEPERLGALAAKHSECTFLVDHMGVDHRSMARNRESDPFTAWASVLALARLQNMYLKVSNAPELSRLQFPFDDSAARVKEAFESFGADRLIWGSNYPPSKERVRYADSVRFCERLPFLSAPDRAKIMGQNILAILTARTRR